MTTFQAGDVTTFQAGDVITVLVDTDRGDPLGARPGSAPAPAGAGPLEGSLTAQLAVNGAAVRGARCTHLYRAIMRGTRTLKASGGARRAAALSVLCMIARRGWGVVCVWRKRLGDALWRRELSRACHVHVTRIACVSRACHAYPERVRVTRSTRSAECNPAAARQRQPSK